MRAQGISNYATACILNDLVGPHMMVVAVEA